MMHISWFPFPPSISISLSSVCNAQCIWCPIGQRLNTSGKNKFIPMDIVDKILADTEGKDIGTIVIADMGEPLLNPNFKEIVLRIRKVHPNVGLMLSSNFFLMDADMSRFVIENFQSVGMNIDGITEEGYYAVKRLPLKVVKDNLMTFLRLREAMYMDLFARGMKDFSLTTLQVAITSEPRYYLEIGEPEKATVPDETRRVHAFLKGLLGLNDSINETITATWAERRKWNRPRDEKTACANILTTYIKCCIDTNGNVIPCCLDYDSECVLGNVMENTIEDIWNGEKRKQFLNKLNALQYESIGLPCSICHD